MKRSYNALRHHRQHVHAELIEARLELKHSIIIDCLLSRNNLGGRQSTQDKNIIGSMNSLYGAERLRQERLLMIPPEKTKIYYVKLWHGYVTILNLFGRLHHPHLVFRLSGVHDRHGPYT